MTREEQILEYANSFNGKGVESEELKEIIRLAIIDGAKWADNHPMKPSLPSNLNKASEEYAFDVKAKPFGNLVKEAFKAGAQWQKEQMMKDAVEGTVHNFSSNKPHPTVLVDAKGFNQGDKVRIIIIKEE